MSKNAVVVALLFTAFAFIHSCKKDDFESGNVSLSFSEDTILFDTVFTTVGSATQVFTVYNNGDKPVKITSLRIAGGSGSNFRLNVDGIPGKSFFNVEIGANDSIFIFAEVTVDPNNQNTPLVLTDSIEFIANGLSENVKLVAWGQDAIFHRAPAGSPIAPYFFLNCNEVWNNDKPHVIYGTALVDSSCSLTINEGTNVYLHPGSSIWILNSATLTINGTVQNKVTIQGDRLGEDYKDVPGQWDRIWLSNYNVHSQTLSPGPKNCTIKNAVIKNGTIGLLVDTAFDNNLSNPTLVMENTIVKNMSSNGMACRGARVDAYNSVFANCGGETAKILYGGKYNFLHCTFANYWENGQRQASAVSINNWFSAGGVNYVRPLDALFGNCILHGNNDNELALDSFPTGNAFGFKFDHDLIKVENSFSMADVSRYINILRATGSSNDPRFTDAQNNIYELDSANSPAIDAGSDIILQLNSILNNDLKGNPRPVGPHPDLGAYERR